MKYKEQGARMQVQTQRFGTEQLGVMPISVSPPVMQAPRKKNLFLEGQTVNNGFLGRSRTSRGLPFSAPSTPSSTSSARPTTAALSGASLLTAGGPETLAPVRSGSGAGLPPAPPPGKSSS